MVLTEAGGGLGPGRGAHRDALRRSHGQMVPQRSEALHHQWLPDAQLVLARAEEGSTMRGLSLFLVERDETLRIRRIENKMGLHASPTCEIQYNNTPAELVGKRRFGLLRYTWALMNGARLAVGGPGYRHRRGGLPRSQSLRRRTPAIRRSRSAKFRLWRVCCSRCAARSSGAGAGVRDRQVGGPLEGLRTGTERKIAPPIRPCARSINRPPALAEASPRW